MKKLIVAVGLSAALLLSGPATAQRHHSRDSGWNWTRHNNATFRNRGQCQKALAAERNLARREATRHRVNAGAFNQRWRLRCVASRQHGRLVYRIG
jgi:hypothetical protein